MVKTKNTKLLMNQYYLLSVKKGVLCVPVFKKWLKSEYLDAHSNVWVFSNHDTFICLRNLSGNSSEGSVVKKFMRASQDLEVRK